MTGTYPGFGVETTGTAAVLLGDAHSACNTWIARLQAKIAEYENGISWGTSCTSCATVLDSSVREHERAGKAEEKLEAVREWGGANLPVIWAGELLEILDGAP